MKAYAYFLGCITPNRYPGIEYSTIEVFRLFGVELKPMHGTSCCPAPGVFGSFDLWNWLVLAARNLSIAEDMGLDVTVTCNGCYATLQEANHMLQHDVGLKEKVNSLLGKVNRVYRGTIKVIHVIEILYDVVGLETIKDRVVKPLKDVRVAVHYGCHFLKPSDIRGHGSPENPTMLDELVEVLGAESVEYKDKLMCCGAGGGVRAGRPETALEITREKVEAMLDAGADCVVTPCAFCHLQFDRGQAELTAKTKHEYDLPVVFITQLLGLALGLSPERLGLLKNETRSDRLLGKLNF